MVIKRGGPGGPRVPPKPTTAQQGERRVEQGPKGPAAPEVARADDARLPAGFEADAFDDDLVVQRSTPGERTEDLFRTESRASAVRNTARLLETTYERLARDYSAVQAEARVLVAELAREGFSPDAVAAVAPELRAHRARLSKVRARLATIRRRLRAISLPAGSVLDAQLKQRLGAQIRSVSSLERGADRALMALQLATTFRPRGADGRPASLVRLDVQGTKERAALGSELARQAPEATSTDTLLRLLSGDAPASDGRAASDDSEGTSDVQALRAFAAAQLGT